jgi:hypothetical protein
LDIKDSEYKKLEQSSYLKTDNYRFFISDDTTVGLLQRIKKDTISLADVCLINNGANTGNAARILLSYNPKGSHYRKILEGKDINRYSTKWGGLWIDYDPDLKKKIDLKDLETRQHKIDFSLRNEDLFNSQKIIVRQTADRLIGTFDDQKYVTRHSTHLLRVKRTFVAIKYLLGLFNSTLLTYYYQNIIPEKGKVFAEVKVANLEKLPIKVVLESQQQPFIELVDRILSLNKHLLENQEMRSDEKEKLIEEIGKIDHSIDELVYEIYGLTEAERRIIKDSID